jgi:hypothetical protein
MTTAAPERPQKKKIEETKKKRNRFPPMNMDVKFFLKKQLLKNLKTHPFQMMHT